MRLTLHSTKVLNLTFRQHGLPEDRDSLEVWVPEKSSSDEQEESSFTLNHTAAFSQEPSREFAVIFDFSTILPDQCVEIELEFLAEFRTDTEISDDFKKSPFPKVNAPAIAFPFLRSFISNLLLNSGYNPLILPSINFTTRP